MLKTINKSYILSAFILYTILTFKIPNDFLLIVLFAIISCISFYFMLYLNSQLKNDGYNKLSLMLEIFFYTLIFIVLENLISYYYRGNFFIFSESDALFYHETTKKLIDMPFSKAINYYLSYMGLDDLGIILVLYPLYLLSDSNLTLNVFYLFVTIITALSIFNIGKNFLSRKYAFMASLSYSISSFVIYYHGTGLKESFMVMVVVLSFQFLYSFLQNNNIKHLILAIIFLSLLTLFRPAIIFFILGAFGFGLLISNRGGIIIKILSFFIFIALIAMSNIIIEMFNSYTVGGLEALIRSREIQGMVKGGITFTYIVNIISQSIGPLPTLFSPSKTLTMFYAPGLIYRNLLAIPFWLGVFYMFKRKEYLLYPLFFFAILEMSFLVLIIDGLELRITMPHMPFVYLIAFWFMESFDKNRNFIKHKNTFMDFIYVIIAILILLMAYWNFR